MHNCADGKSWIKVKHEGKIYLTRIEDLAESIGLADNKLADVSKDGWQILSRDGWTKLKNISRRRLKDDEELYTIKTRTGIPIKLTGEHRLPILKEDGKEEVVKVKDLKIGDSLLDVENIRLSEEELSDSFLNLLELNDDKLDLRITNLSSLKSYLNYRYNVNYTKLASLNNFVISPNLETMKLSDFVKLTKDYPVSFDVYSNLLIKSCGSKHTYPLHIPYTPQLAKLYAYIYADGGVYVNEKKSTFHVTFTNTNESLVDDFIDCYEVVFGYRLNKSYPTSTSTSPCIRATDSTRLVVKLFKDFAGARKNGSSDISIPDFVISGTDEIKRAYISACIDTDGCISRRGFNYSSCSEGYCQQLAIVLKSLGYHPTVVRTGKAGKDYQFNGKKGKRNFDCFAVTMSRNDEIADLLSKSTCLKHKDTYVYRGLKNKYTENKIVSILTSHEDCSVYDMETASHWYVINNYVSHNCLSVPFDDLLASGFNTRQVDIRPANSINTAFQLIAVIFQIQSLQQFGGVSATHLDWTMVPYVRKSFYKHYKDGLEFILDLGEEQIENFGINDTMSIEDEKYKSEPRVYNYSLKLTTKELNQAAEGMYHNLNSLQSRSGCQLPFTSINYGTCTLIEGRMVIKALLDGSIKGVGKFHRTSIFPCGIFQYMKGVNDKPGTPNYDLYRLALESTAKRLYPNYANVDWSGNAGYDINDPRTYFSTMGK